LADEQEVDEVDEADVDATEAALAAVLLAALIEASPTTGAPPGITPDAWLGVVEGSGGRLLRDYLTRTASRFLRAAGVPGPRAAEMTEEVVSRAYPEALADVAEGAAAIYRTGRDVSTGARPFGPGSKTRLPPAGTKGPTPTSLARPGGIGTPTPSGTGGTGVGPPIPPQHARDAETYHRIRVGSAQLARHQATALREAVRYNLAGQLGASHMTWRSRMDPKVRPTHGGLEGDSVPFGKPWTTYEGNELRWPGDPLAPISETANCRCRVSYRLPSGQPVATDRAGVPQSPPSEPHRDHTEFEGVPL
jgi:hypothetical protein